MKDTALDPAVERGSPQTWRATLALAGGVLGLTLSPLFFRWADAPALVTSFYRMLITALVLSPLVRLAGKQKTAVNWPLMLIPVVGGVASALDHSFWSSAIERTTVANATLLNNVSPLWVGLFAWLVLKEKLKPGFWVGLVAVLAGATMVLGSTVSARPAFAQGDLLALTSSVFYAGFFLLTQKGRTFLATVRYLWMMTVSAAAVLLLVVSFFKLPLAGFTSQTYVTFLAAALISQFGAYFLISYSLGSLPASVVTPTMVAQPVITALLAIPIAGEALLLPQAVGGLVTLVGIYLINSARRRA